DRRPRSRHANGRAVRAKHPLFFGCGKRLQGTIIHRNISVSICKYVREETNHMLTPRLTPELIAAAVEGYESQKTRIDRKIAELRAILSGGPVETAATPEPATRRRRKMSAAGRKAIAEAQRKRWAEARKAIEPAPQNAAKPKRRISKEGMKRIVAATKKRWAAVRAAK